MMDLKLLQKDFDGVEKALSRRQIDAALIDSLKSVYMRQKEKRSLMEEKKAEQNKKSKLFGQYKQEGKDIAPLKAEVDELKAQIAADADEVQALEEELWQVALQIPNFPDASVPDGESEEENVEIKKVLEPKTFAFQPKEHWELAEQNGWIDFERGVKLAHSRFSLLNDMGARLSRALINLMLDHNRQYGFVEMATPALVNPAMLQGTGQLPKFADDLYKIEGEELYLIPTAEVTLTNIHHDEILEDEQLPVCMTGYTPCFRKEAGSARRDTRGIIRQHQFDKVELVALTKPDESEAIHEKMVACASSLLEKLELPHRLMELCTGDMGFSAAKTIDIEVWLPGQGCYREISSISNTRDFQARRAKIRYKDKESKKNILCHTLNGSSLAVGRTLVAIMENGQQEDGSIVLPPVLQEYLR